MYNVHTNHLRISRRESEYIYIYIYIEAWGGKYSIKRCYFKINKNNKIDKDIHVLCMWYMRPHQLYKKKRYELIYVKSNVSRNTEFRHVVKVS